jgi:myo-inositol catabolism protein IolC
MGGILMNYGYGHKLFILAFDHRGSFQKKWFGLEGEPTEEDTRRISDAKHLVFEGLLHALEEGATADSTGALVDEQFGVPTSIPSEAKERGLKLAMPVEKSGQNEFDFEYGDEFGAHIEEFDPDFSKVLVRYNPDDPDIDMNRRQLDRLKRLSDWLHEHDRKFLFELLVPATDDQLARADGDTDRYDAELRPELMRRAIEDIQGAGIEVDIWKIEGVDERSDAEMLAEQTRAGGRDRVTCVLLGRGASDEKVDHWLSQAAPVDGFIGFAIGRSIWGGPLKAFLDGSVDRDVAAREIGGNYLRFINVYDDSEAAVAGR